ncbi:MAG: DUF5062 family protein [Pseudomonadales bacterium]|nr:DUF5062 family protein [Pseudomonadales bacterium]
MKKLENEAALLKEAVRVGMVYAQKRGAAQFEASDSAKEKVVYIYRLLVHDKVIQPLAKGKDDIPAMKHKLALWMHKNLPDNHDLK